VEECSIGVDAEVRVPLRVRPKRSKTVLGPYARVTGHYYILLSLVPSGSAGYRWEPHIIVDRAGTLQAGEGVAVVSGPVVLLEYKGLRDAMERAVREGCIRHYHLAPWGAPGILALDARGPDEEEWRALREAGLEGAGLLARELARHTRIVEV